MEKITIYQVKWYDEKAKSYEDDFISDLEKCLDMAKAAFEKGSKYFSINLINVK